MFHTCAYYVSLAGTANTNVTPVQDDVLTIANAHFLPQSDMDIIYAYAGCALLDRARIVSPTNRVITLPFIRPVQLTASPASPPAIADYTENPFRIRGLEELSVEASATGAGPGDAYAVLGLQRNYEPVPRGNIFTLRGASTTASVQATWVSTAMTWADQLPEGLYAVVGGTVVAATGIAFRLIFEGQVERPGALQTILATGADWSRQYKGGLGIWGRFRPTAMPTVQVLNNAAVAAHTAYLDIMRLA
jgi:hypothetical protein